MKNISILMFVFLSLTTLYSCKKDPCDGKVCLNGGVCVDGTCLCSNGYSGPNCATPPTPPDPCLNVTCLNGGYCSNGQCVCPQGYTGSNCSVQVTPTQMRITKIEVIRFPATNGGAGWDLTSGPDIYPLINLNGTTIWDSPNYTENANPNSVYTFTPNPAIAISPVNQYSIILYDYDDLDADDFMGGINFVPYSSTGGFPTTRVVDAGGSVAFRLTFSYSW